MLGLFQGSADQPEAASSTPLPGVEPSTFQAWLVAATDQAQSALIGEPSIAMTAFPFKIGREARSPSRLQRVQEAVGRRLRRVAPLNDVFLVESHGAIGGHISRQHCTIEHVDHGYYLVDTTSTLGTVVVRGRDAASATLTQVGGGSDCRAFELERGDLIVLGTTESPYVFRFDLEPTHA